MDNQNKIHVLPESLVNQIAAGEVVERPASVVKELVENSIDAGAQNITVEIENGGINLIRVIDDGMGMSREDARLSIVQHATSKISSLEDLFRIGTMGFRGEALASIASVSEFTLVTKTADSLSGTELTVISSVISDRETGSPTGTSITVKNLFYNVPARQKYLKTAVTEYNHIADLFLNYVLAYSQINWRLSHNGRVIYQFYKTTDLRERVREVLGREIADNLLELNFDSEDIKISGFIGKPQIARNNRKLQFLFINERPVIEHIIAKQVKDSYATLIPHNLFPFFILFIQVNPEKIDVNVHPRKLEVRFSEPSRIYQAVYRVIGDTLDKNILTKEVVAAPFVARGDYMPNASRSFSSPDNFTSELLVPLRKVENLDFPPVAQSFNLPFSNDSAAVPTNDYKFIGQVANSYLILETDKGLKIIDQHAVSERVQYEKLRAEWILNSALKQKLLLPERLVLPPQEASRLRQSLSLFIKLGFDVEDFGGDSFVINSVPQLLVGRDYLETLKTILGELEVDCINEDNKITDSVEKVLKVMACRSAIKFGDPVSEAECRALLLALEKCDNKYTCVHGRPNTLEYTFVELERLFKRRN